MPEKIAIIGSGPAGWASAIYAARANLDPVVYEGLPTPDMIPLGQLAYTTEVENYPGFPFGDVWSFVQSAIDTDKRFANLPGPPTEEEQKDGKNYYAVRGLELMELMKQQALNFGTRVESDAIKEVDFSGDVHKLIPEYGDPIEAHTVVVATGARANYLGLESEERFKNRGVSACAVCDGALPRFRETPLAVVGGGDSAVEEATYLANLKGAKTIYLIHRRDELRASKIMQERALNHPKIELVWNSEVEEVLGDDEQGVTGLKVKNNKEDSTSELEVGGMFAAIGHTPNTGFLKGKLDMNKKGYIRWTKPFRTNTSVAGVFAAGDVADDYYRQAITSAGTGCMSALDAERYLAEIGK